MPDAGSVCPQGASPLNTYGLSKKVIYENEEFHLLQSALDVEEGLDGLRYNKIVVATDADVDGMHIRLLLLSLLPCRFFPDLIAATDISLHSRNFAAHRVRNKKRTIYCYSESDKQGAVAELGAGHEITLEGFKGSPVKFPRVRNSRISSARTSGSRP